MPRRSLLQSGTPPNDLAITFNYCLNMPSCIEMTLFFVDKYFYELLLAWLLLLCIVLVLTGLVVNKLLGINIVSMDDAEFL